MIAKASIFIKVFSLMAVVSIIAAALVLGIAIREQSQFIEGSIVQKNKLLAKVVSQSIESDYFIGKWPFETLKEISESGDIIFLWIVKPNGKIYLADDAEMWGKWIDDPNVGTTETVVKDYFSPKTNENIKLIVHPLDIKDNGVPWTLYMGVSLAPITVLRNQMISYSLITFAAILVIVGLFAYYLAKGFTKPIKELAEACDKVSRGDLTIKVDIKTNDEIEDFAKSFERMVGSIQVLKKSYEKPKKPPKRKEIVDPRYNELVKAIVNTISSFVGPVAIMLANKVSGLSVTPHNVTIIRNPQDVMSELINEYKKIMGPTAITLSKRGAKPILEKNPDLKVPEDLK